MLDNSQRTTVSNDTYRIAGPTNTFQQTSLDWHTSTRNASRIAMEHTTPPTPPLTQSTLSLLTWPPEVIGGSNTTTMPVNPLTATSFRTHTNVSSNNFSFAAPTSSNSNNIRYTNYNNHSNYTNTTTNHLDDDNDVLHTIEYIGSVLSFYYVPIIVCTGSLGNLLSVVVFFKTKLRKLSSSIYLGALAVSDTCFLLGLFAQWLNFIDVNIYNREYFCQFFTFFSNLACFCSNWFVVAFTVERFIAVMYPLKRQTMCTVRRAKMVLLGLTLLGCLHCAPFLISSTPVYSPKAEMTICDIKSEYKDYITILNYWDTVVVFAIPFTTIAVLNTFTGCTVWKFATVRRTLTMQKMKTHHLPMSQQHETIVSTPLTSNCDTTTVSMTTTATVAAAGLATTATVADQQQQQVTSATYRLTTIAATSLKRSKLNCCAATTHLNGHESSVAVSGDPHLLHSHRGSMKAHQYSRHLLNNNPNIASHQHSQPHPHPPPPPHLHQQKRRHFTMGTKNCCTSGTCTDASRKSGRRKHVNSSQLKVTKMLLIVSTVFVCLNLPSFIMRMITFLETQASTNEKTTIVLQYIFQLFFVTNFGINFVLYCVSGQNFRKAFLSIFRRVPATQRDVTTQITSKYASEYHCNSGCGQMGGIGGASSLSSSRNMSTRRRMMMSQNSWKEVHEMQCIK